MTTAATQLTVSPSPKSIWSRGGERAPERARRHVLSQLESDFPRERVWDAALIVSELVTNSVVHANVGNDQALWLELIAIDGQLRIAVIDSGSELEPRLLPDDPTRAGGFGLRLVNEICSTWGVARDPTGMTRVWCALPISP